MELVSTIFNIYVDSFLLYLLYKFLKPSRITDDGKTEAQVILFALNDNKAQSNVLKTFQERYDEGGNAIRDKIDDLFKHVIKEWKDLTEIESTI